MAERILVVDDDPGALKLIGYVLKREGFEVSTAASGMEALARLRAESVDLIVLDIMMPGMDGYEVCRRLRSNPSTTHLPVIMLTARSMVKDKVSGFSSGADDYVVKPILPADLTSRVRALLHRARLARAAGPAVPGRTLALVSVLDGVDASALAIVIASHLAAKGRSAILADWNPSSTSLTDRLGIAPSHGLHTLLERDPLEILARYIQPYLVECGGTLRALPAPAHPGPPDQAARLPALQALGQQLTLLADWVVLDMGRALRLPTHTLLSTADAVVLVSEATPLGVRSLQEEEAALLELPEPRPPAQVVLIHQDQGPDAAAEAAASALGGRAALIGAAPPGALQGAPAARIATLTRSGTPFTTQVGDLVQRLLQTPPTRR